MKNLPVRLFFLCFPLIILQEVFCLIQAIRAQHLFAYLRALGHAMRHLPGMLRCRHKIQAHRVVNDTYVRKLMCFKEPLRIFYYKLRGSRVTGTY